MKWEACGHVAEFHINRTPMEVIPFRKCSPCSEVTEAASVECSDAGRVSAGGLMPHCCVYRTASSERVFKQHVGPAPISLFIVIWKQQ
jgi:hypothetical protein